MKSYYLEFGRASGGYWSAILTIEENNKFDFVRRLDNFLPIEQGDESIKMIITNAQVKENRLESDQNHFDNEIFLWGDDLMVGGFKSFNATNLIVSKKLKDVIKNFKLPPHSVYRLELINYDDKNDIKEYFMIHIHNRLIDHADYAKSEFKEYSTRTKEVFDIKTGVFTDVEDYLENKLINRNNRIFMEFNKFVLKEDYDVIWGYGANLLISEKLKNAIEEAGIQKAVSIRPFKEFQIINKSEYDQYGVDTPHPIS